MQILTALPYSSYLFYFGALSAIVYSKVHSLGHSENIVTMQSGLFESEIGPGVLQCSPQQTLGDIATVIQTKENAI